MTMGSSADGNELGCRYSRGQSYQTAIVIFFVVVSCQMPRIVTGFEPGFISPLDNITVAAGRSAQFTCVVKHLGGHKVAWLRSDSKAILAIHTHMVTNNPRMSVSHNGHNSWTMSIDVVQRNDSGLYMCQINTEPMTSQVGVLNVVEAPDILYNETSNDTIVAEGASVQLRCEARGYPEPTVTWRREDGTPIVLRSQKSTRRVETVEGSQLDLERLTRADMGAYLCIASNGIPSPVSKRIMVHVHFHPLVKVHDQLVTTRLRSKVSLTCTVEASPRSVNYWVKLANKPGERDRAINPSGRYEFRDIAKSLYTTVVSLTIPDVRRHDLGNYTCVARNSLGTVRGTVSLQPILEPNKPTQTEEPPHIRNENRGRDHRQNERVKERHRYKVSSTEKSTNLYYVDVTRPTYSFEENPNNDEDDFGDFDSSSKDGEEEAFSFSSSTAAYSTNKLLFKTIVLTVLISLTVV